MVIFMSKRKRLDSEKDLQVKQQEKENPIPGGKGKEKANPGTGSDKEIFTKVKMKKNKIMTKMTGKMTNQSKTHFTKVS